MRSCLPQPTWCYIVRTSTPEGAAYCFVLIVLMCILDGWVPLALYTDVWGFVVILAFSSSPGFEVLIGCCQIICIRFRGLVYV